MKYFVVKTHKSYDFEITLGFKFPKVMIHLDFFDSVQNMMKLNGKDDVPFFQCIGAGFVKSDMKCHGRSETLNINSRRDDDYSLFKKELHYIVVKPESGEEFGLIFSKEIDHATVLDIFQHTRVHTGHRNDWSLAYETAKCLGAGMIDMNGKCFGEGESLGISSRDGIDAQLLKKQYSATCL